MLEMWWLWYCLLNYIFWVESRLLPGSSEGQSVGDNHGMPHVATKVSLQSHFCVYFDAHRLQLITDSNDNAIVDHLDLKISMLIVVDGLKMQ